MWECGWIYALPSVLKVSCDQIIEASGFTIDIKFVVVSGGIINISWERLCSVELCPL